jgi:hypothetical protein
MSTLGRTRYPIVVALALLPALAACPGNKEVTPIVTSVGRAVGTVVKTSGVAVACGGALAPDPVAFYAAKAPADQLFPIAGFELFRTPACAQARLDAYRGLVSFNMASVSNLKGLVTKAELVVTVHALPPAAGSVVTFAGFFNATCPAMFGGGGSLERFGPAAAATIAPLVQASGKLTMIDPGPFPTGNTVYTFPSTLPTTGSAPFPVTGAASPTTMSASGNGGVTFVTDVTSQVNAALNGNAAAMSWMLTSVFETTPPAALPPGGNRDCRTAYEMDLRLTHL